MYAYTDFDRQFIRNRAAQHRDQLARNQAGTLSDEAFRPLRLQNGWYIQRYAPMLRVAVPYGEIAARQLRVLATIARDYDRPDAELLARAQATQDGIDERAGSRPGPRLKFGYGHFTTRQNVQFNWIPLARSADVMDLLASVDMHGIQTSGNCIRNITTDDRAGIAADEVVDPRPFAEILRQWSTLHPEFAFLPRKFKVAIHGAREDRAAIAWHDVGLQVVRRQNTDGEDGSGSAHSGIANYSKQTSDKALFCYENVGFKVLVGGGMGRTPVVASVIREFLPWDQILNYLEAVVRVYNRWGRRDNKYKARIKILVKAEGERFVDEVEAEYQAILSQDGAPHTITLAELQRVAASFVPPALNCDRKSADAKIANILSLAGPRQEANAPTDHEGRLESSVGSPSERMGMGAMWAAAEDDVEFGRWLQQNVAAHKNPDLRAVTLSFKRLGQAPGDAAADQLDAVAELAERFSAGEARVTHDQNMLLPWVRCDQLPELWREARRLGLAKPNIRLLTDMIACPGGDFCALANARAIPLAAAIAEHYTDLDELHDLGEIDLHISGCINSCGHHHTGHIGVLGVDKDGQEWYQVTLGGSDGSRLSGAPGAGKVVGPSFAADEVLDVVEALIDTYRAHRLGGETFITTLRRVGHEPYKVAANAVRHITARPAEAPSEVATAV